MPQMSPFNWTLMFMLFLMSSIALMSKMFFIKKTSTLFHIIKHNNLMTPTLYIWTW